MPSWRGGPTSTTCLTGSACWPLSDTSSASCLGTVLEGGKAAALHAHHRRSSDGDHVVADLRDRFDDVLASLEAAAGWRTERFQRPVLILGTLDGILTGIRQLRRTQPLEIEEREGLRVPTLAEMARIKTWLLYRGLAAPWKSWQHVATRGRFWAPVVARIALEPRP